VIERLLAAERALEAGQLEVAERLYGQVEAADPRNAIAMTGRAKVAQAQGDLDGARRHVTRALETDPDDQAAKALSAALESPIIRAPTAQPAPAATPRPGPAPAPVPPVAGVARPSIAGSIARLLRRLVGR